MNCENVSSNVNEDVITYIDASGKHIQINSDTEISTNIEIDLKTRFWLHFIVK